MTSETSDYGQRLHALDDQLTSLMEARQDSRDVDESREADDNFKKSFIAALQEICSVIREADVARPVDFDQLVARADEIIARGVDFAYGLDEDDIGEYDFMPSFAHAEHEPFVSDDPETPMAPYLMESFFKMVILPMREKFGPNDPIPKDELPKLPKPWSRSHRPHANTSRIARFRETVPTFSSSEATPTALMIHQARCEARGTYIGMTTDLNISSDGSCMVLTSMGGWKNRDPFLKLFRLGDTDSFGDSQSIKVGLQDTISHTALVEDRKLIFAADNYRVKSYAWGTDDGEIGSRSSKEIHTLNSSNHDGPLIALSEGRVLRAGKGSAAVWNIDALDKHDDNGKAIVGGHMGMEDLDSWRDEGSVEPSIGSVAHSVLRFEDSNFKPGQWVANPLAPGIVLAAADDSSRKEPRSSVSFAGLDLEHGGKYTTRYLGHGGEVERICVSQGDANAFVTGCSDGIARLYDARHPLPALSMGVASDSGCTAVAIAHPDGIPTVFTGSVKGERVSLWDVRAGAPLYELATGNNAVTDVAWDWRRNTLYAATDCHYVDRMGRTFDYRRAKKPKADQPDDRHINIDSESDEEDYHEHRCWPEKAYHKEDYYGYNFDASNHRLYQYAFKPNADINIVPSYGHGTLDSGGSGGFW